jgi:hypothetical protein
MSVPLTEAELLSAALYKAVRQVNTVANRVPGKDAGTDEVLAPKVDWNQIGQNHLKKQASLTALPAKFLNSLKAYRTSVGHGVQGFKQVGRDVATSPRAVGSLYAQGVKNSWNSGNRLTAPFRAIKPALGTGLNPRQVKGMHDLKTLTLRGSALGAGTYFGNKFYNDKQRMLAEAYADPAAYYDRA